MNTTQTAMQTAPQTQAIAWPATLPPLTRIEAERAVKRLERRFKFRYHWPFEHRWRRWVAANPPAQYDTIVRGWPRLVRDVASEKAQCDLGRGSFARTHHEMLKCVLERGWLDGKLKPKPKAKTSPQEMRKQKLGRTLASIKRWQAKAKRVQTALKKLERRRRYYESKLAA